MRDETKMDVYTSGVTGAEYDAGMKQLMSNKEIIVPILQMTVPEFKTCSQEEILQCLDISSITKDDFVSDIPNVEKDLRLTKEDSELSSLVEKLVRFDIRFKIINPKLSTEKIRVNLHIDMEAQKSYRPSNPSYPILKRAVYYVARDLSSQLSTITQTTVIFTHTPKKDWCVDAKCHDNFVYVSGHTHRNLSLIHISEPTRH